MSGNDSGSTDQYVFGAWLNSTFIRKSDFEKHKAEFGQELSEKILQEMSRTEAIGVNVSGGQYGLTEKVKACTEYSKISSDQTYLDL